MPALYNYLLSVNRLLHNQSGSLYSASDLTAHINAARKQIAMEGACIRGLLSFSTTASNKSYAFSSFTVPSSVGQQSVVAVRQLYLGGPIASRPWEWYAQYYLSANTSTSVATTWAQLMPGTGGTLYLYPIPNGIVTYVADCVIIPLDLSDASVNATEVEALPYPWTDVIQYYAAYLTLTGISRAADADRMWGLYQRFIQRARDLTVPSQLPRNFPLSSQIVGVATNAPTSFPTSGPTSGGKNGPQ